MATVKLSAAKSAGAAISYAEGKNRLGEATKDWLKQHGVADTLVDQLSNRAVVIGGENIDLEHVRGQMRATRELFNKNTGVQAHRIIQSFSSEDLQAANPDDWQRANELGIELGRRMAPNHEVVVYTHIDGEGHKLHNHIIINAPDLLTGTKYHEHNDFDRVAKLNDQLVQENGLSVVKTKQHERKTMAERHIKQDDYVWKDDLRRRIDYAMQDTRTIDYKRFSEVLFESGVNINVRGKDVSYAFLDANKKQRAARGTKLGASYEKETIFDELARRTEQLGQINQRASTGTTASRTIQRSVETTTSDLSNRNHTTERLTTSTQDRKSTVDDTINFSQRLKQSALRGLAAIQEQLDRLREKIEQFAEQLANRLAVQEARTRFHQDMATRQEEQALEPPQIKQTQQKLHQKDQDQGLSL